jgi:trans-2-enoyl-CoA reductase
VETSTDLVNWIDVLVSDPNLSNNAGSVSYTLIGADRLFVRFKVLLD